MMYKNNFVVIIKCNGRILRERGGVVYLPFGAEYSIMMKNMDARKALVEIEVDGENVLNGHKLIVEGNSKEEINGFMRDMNETNRFKFINKTEEIQNHRGDKIEDGLVKISYQFESDKDNDDWRICFTTPSNTMYGTTKCGDPTSSSDSTWVGSVSNNTYSGDCACFASFSDTVGCSAPLSDEGITVKGTKVNQNYQYGNIGTLEQTIHTIVLQLKGETKKHKVKKPLTVKTKIKCETCGRKNKSTNKFCYNCGTYLN